MEKKHQGLSAGHLTMMALGSVIGGSFFIGTAVAINAAGPAVLISYILGGMIFSGFAMLLTLWLGLLFPSGKEIFQWISSQKHHCWK